MLNEKYHTKQNWWINVYKKVKEIIGKLTNDQEETKTTSKKLGRTESGPNIMTNEVNDIT